MISLIRSVILLITCVSTYTNFTTSYSVTTYAGSCKCYRRVATANNTQTFTSIFAPSFGKVVLDRPSKQFSFYFNDTQICSDKLFVDAIDNVRGGECFVLNDGNYTAYLYIAEKKFIIDIPPRKSDPANVLGYEFVIMPYRIN